MKHTLPSKWSWITSMLLLTGIFTLEVYTNILGNVAYVAAAACAFWLTKDRLSITGIAILASVFLIGGYVWIVGVQELADHATFLVNRISALIALWFARYFTIQYRLTQEQEQLQRMELAERRLAEERLKSSLQIYQAIAQNFSAGWVGIIDENLHWVVADGKGLAYLGLQKAEIKGKHFSAILDATCEANLQESLAGKNVEFETSFGNRIFEVKASLIHGDMQPRWVLVVVHDITILKETEAGLLKSLENERVLSEMKSRFITMASHEFRTPLTTILSSASLLQNYNGNNHEKERTNHVNKIKQAVKLLTDLLTDLLSFGKLENEIQRPSSEKIILNTLLEEIKDEAKLFQHDHQKLIVKHTGEPSFISDRTFLKIILRNLLSNAFKYSDRGHEVILAAEVRHDLLRFEVTDFGMGILPEDRNYIYDRFFRGQNAVNIQGTGLGLSVVKQYLKLLNGTIHFTSNPGEQTVFIIEFQQQPQAAA